LPISIEQIAGIPKKEIIQRARENIKQFLFSMNSYLGIVKHYNTYKLRKKMITKNLSTHFWNYIYTSNNYEKLASKI